MKVVIINYVIRKAECKLFNKWKWYWNGNENYSSNGN